MKFSKWYKNEGSGDYIIVASAKELKDGVGIIKQRW